MVEGGFSVKTLSAVVCFMLAGVMPIALKFDRQKENQKMHRPETAVKFIKSDTLPPSIGYSQAVTVKSGRLASGHGSLRQTRRVGRFPRSGGADLRKFEGGTRGKRGELRRRRQAEQLFR